MPFGRSRARGGGAAGGLQVDPIEVIWYVDDDAPPAEVVPAVERCACGHDHVLVPLDQGGRETVCREHKRHEPCQPCARRRRQGVWGGHV